MVSKLRNPPQIASTFPEANDEESAQPTLIILTSEKSTPSVFSMVPIVASSLPAIAIPIFLPFKSAKELTLPLSNTIKVFKGVAIRVAERINGKPTATSMVKLVWYEIAKSILFAATNFAGMLGSAGS